MITIAEVLARLKGHLREREGSYHKVNEWCGDTERGFWDEHEFDLVALFKEIDEFGEELRATSDGNQK